MPEPRRTVRRKVNYFRIFYVAMIFLIFILMIYGIAKILSTSEKEAVANKAAAEKNAEKIYIELETQVPTMPPLDPPQKSDDYTELGSDIVSEVGLIVNVTDGEIIAGKNPDARIYPASMTKIMTLIVGVENMTSMTDTFTMTHEILEPLVNADASMAGFEDGETVTVRDMLYGTVLPSGADATVGLSLKLCGSEKAFVELMNKKAEEMGLENTHFENSSGLHHQNHYTTPKEMAMILEYAMQSDICRTILSTYEYTTSPTTQHPEGLVLHSTMFSKMYGNEVQGAQIIGGKTGFTDEAGHCLATFGTKNNKEYITITGKSYSAWKSVYDAFNLYALYISPQTEIVITPE